MSQARQDTQKTVKSQSRQDELRNSPMMVHLLDALQARALPRHVSERDHNPPKRERILEWQSQQDFPT